MKVIVKMLQMYGVYNANEIAGFNPDVAGRMIHSIPPVAEFIEYRAESLEDAALLREMDLVEEGTPVKFVPTAGTEIPAAPEADVVVDVHSEAQNVGEGTEGAEGAEGSEGSEGEQHSGSSRHRRR